MKRAFAWLLPLFAALSLSLFTVPRQSDAAGVEWLTDYAAALKQAVADDKPIFLEFR